jgi:hypothetical protein
MILHFPFYQMPNGCKLRRMRRPFLVFLVLGLLGAVSVGVSAELTAEALAAHLEAKIVAPQPPKGAEAIILRDLEPLRFRAEVKDTVCETFNLRQKSEDMTWRCSSGEVKFPRGPWEALWVPPARSETATIAFRYSAAYNKFPRSLFYNDIEIGKDARVIVITPTAGSRLRKGVLDGFTMGEYLNPHDRETIEKYAPEVRWFEKHPQRYTPPEFFYKVTRENRNLRISEHFTLGDFAFDYPWFSLGLPQYIALDYDIVEKVEDLLGLMQRDGLAAHGFKFVYAFRPPSYNLSSIVRDGEETLKAPFSMHQYGRAVDLIVDEDNDLVMDDLNGDGKIDIHDAAVIMHYVNILDRRYREEGKLKVGGAGLYARNDFHERVQTPYIHIDVRGFLDDQGHLIRWPARYPDGSPIRFGDL